MQKDWKGRVLVIVGITLLSVLSTSCAGLGGGGKGFSLKLWPLFHYQRDSEGARSKLRILGPLIYRRKGVEEGEFAVRPLFYRIKDGKENSLTVEYLYPLGKFRREGDDAKHYIVPFLSSRDEKREEGKTVRHFSLFPFFRGQAEDGQEYWGVFPLYGHLVDRFGRDRIRFYLWPIYSDWSDEGTYTWNILWPILSGTRGERKAFRVWPLWGYEEKEGISRVDFILWPFFVKSMRGLNTDDPEREYFLFPLYRGVRSKGKRQVTILWPFFSHTVDQRNRYKRWDAPWPFISFSRAEKMRRVMLFPLYHSKEAPGHRTRWVLWPLYQRWEDQMGNQREMVRRFLLINRVKTVFNRKGEKISKQVSIWPFFAYSREGDEVSLRLLHLIPFRDEGVERNWAPLYSIFRYKRSASRKKWNILWGLYERGDPWD